MQESCTARPPLAVVGIGCRFPGGITDAASFWTLLTEGRSGVVEVPETRWNRDRYYHADRSVPGRMVTKWGGFLGRPDQFDPQFWGISPREAVRMDPQQRWLLEVAWEAIEDAGIAPSDLRSRPVGVFVGIAGNDYAGLQMPNYSETDVHTNSGCTLSIASNRISYLLDLKGPSVSIDTACSSALVAMSQACQSIWSGDCEAVLAGGVNAILTPHATIGFSKASMLSPSGQCFAFDERANGYVRGEGAAMVLIKPLEAAISAGDPIYAVIRSAVVNQDGHTSSMTVPGVESQSAMLRQAYRDAGIPANHVTYMEAHGTGTPVGDPIEATALGKVLGEGRPADNPCLVGSVKTNIGHLESGSGIAGFIKAALVLRHDTVPPSLNFQTPNPNIPFERLGLKIVDRLQPLPHLPGVTPTVGVNSFGFGGTNAHVVLEAGPESERKRHRPSSSNRNGTLTRADRPYVLPISARDEIALQSYVAQFRDSLEELDSERDLADLCYSAGSRKENHFNRLAVIGSSRDELRRRLARFLNNPSTDQIIQGKAASGSGNLVFVFTGQGAQWWKMGRELFVSEPIFSRMIERIDALLMPLSGWSLVEEMTAPQGEEESGIDQTNIAQPAIFALQVALAELWMSWGIQPAIVVGHSVGEVAAAYVAGVYSLEDAVSIIFHRSRLQNSAGGDGRMAAVGISASEARALVRHCQDQVQVAVVNSPGMVTLAGDREPLEKIVCELQEDGKFVRMLRINYAFHTHHMDSIQDELLDVLSHIQPQSARIPFISTVTGSMQAGEKLDASYWWRNVRQPVLFSTAMANLIRAGERSFLELGPHPALESSLVDALNEQGKQGQVYHSLKRGASEAEQMLSNLAQMYVDGRPIDWAAVNQSDGRFVRLPSYPWNYGSYWLESEQSAHERLDPIPHPLLGQRQPAEQPVWTFELDPRLFGYVSDHRIWDSIVFPGAGYGEIGLAIARELFPSQPYVVEDLEIARALFVSEKRVPTVRVSFDEAENEFRIYSTTDNEHWELNSRGRLVEMPTDRPEPVDLSAIRKSLPDHWGHQEYYDDFDAAGYQFGPNFKHITSVWRTFGEVLAEINVPEDVSATVDDYRIHPAVLDACFHAFKGLKQGGDPKKNFFLPAFARRIRLYSEKPDGRLWAHARMTHDEADSVVSDLRVYDDEGNPVAEIFGFRVDRMDQSGHESDLNEIFFQQHWEPTWLPGSRTEGTCNFATADAIHQSLTSLTEDVYQRYQLAAYYHDFTPRMEAVVRQAIQNAYLQLGWNPSVGEVVTSAGLCEQLRIVEQHHRLVRVQLRYLSDAGVLQSVHDDEWKVLVQPTCADLNDELDSLAADFPRLNAEVQLQRNNSESLSAVLCGEIDPVKLLFPDGRSELLDTYYVEAFDFPAFLELIPEALAKAVERLPKRRSLRVLEIGAGTGSLTKAVLPILPPDKTEYLFTDITPAFIANAKQQLSDYPFVEYGTFDIERAPAEQGIKPGTYDVILATNVVHTTKDVQNALKNLRACLAPGGMLMFEEIVTPRVTLDNIFGILEGWWHYTDTDLRSDSALMRPERWFETLEACGFHGTGCFHCSPHENEVEQAVFVTFAPEQTEPESESCEDLSPECRPEAYVVLADRGGFGAELANRLRAIGHRAVEITIGEVLVRHQSDRWTVDPSSDTDFGRVLGDLSDTTSNLAGIIHCWSLENPSAEDLTLDKLETCQQHGVLSLLHLAKALGNLAADDSPRVHVVTRGVNRVIDGDRVTGIGSSPIQGLTRVANNEYPTLQWTTIDLCADRGSHDVDDLLDEILIGDAEREVAYRNDVRYASRVSQVKPTEMSYRTGNAVRPDAAVVPYRLETSRAGILTNLSLNETLRREPGPGEVEVQVKAGGINFRDVMKALAMYPGNPIDLLWFGDDFSGTVVKVGPGVEDIKVGDDVAGMAPYSFRSFNTVDRRMLFPKPGHLSFEEAATLSTVFLTTHYAINHLARMQRGEKILIHAGTGGVGQAAIQISQHLGLEIFATAGTPQKRQILRDMGVAYVMDSRKLDFADEIMQVTDGQGVDAVLNSLAGEFIPKSFSVLAPFGRFLEIGKIDIYNNSRLGLEQLRNNISYFVIDLAQHLEHRPDFVASMFAELAERFEAGDYRPLSYRTFPITDVVEAFRYMAQGKHIGKNVLSFEVDDIPIGPCTDDGHVFRGNATYLIVGGAGGFGLEIAKWMTQHGAQHIVLLSRSGPRDNDSADAIASLRQQGIDVIEARGDVTKRDDVRTVINRIQSEMPPLTGVIHGAMVLDDEFIAELDETRFNRVLHPKILGAWNLHLETFNVPLEHFICLSSVSSIIGAAKQSNYNAGNFFLDCLAHHRRAQGLPSLTINWGALGGAGFVERNEKTALYLEKLGMSSLSMVEALSTFRRVIARDAVQIATSRIDWEAIARVSPYVASSPTFAAMLKSSASSEAGGAIRPRLMSAGPAERLDMLKDFIADQVAGVFGIEADQVDRDTSLTNLGLDSLMAIDLINRIENELGTSIPMGNVLRGPSLNELAESLVDIFAGEEGGDGDDLTPSSGTVSSLEQIQKNTRFGDEFPLTDGQQALWFLYRLAPGSSAYNLTFSSRFTPHVDTEAMGRAFRLLVQRHPMLDVTFSDEYGYPVQRLRRDGSLEFSEFDARSLDATELHGVLVEHANRPFNLETGPVVRLELFRTEDGHVGLMSMHHIMSDAWSVTVLVRDLIETYFTIRAGREPQLSEIPIQFADFVGWEQDHLGSDSGKKMGQFWQKHISGAPHVLNLPTDHPRPKIQSFRGGAHGFKLDDDCACLALQSAARHNVTLFTLLLSVYDLLLHRYTQQPDFLVGVPMAGRQQRELHDVVGYFVNPVPLRSRVNDDPTFEQHLERTQASVNSGLENQQYPFRRMVHEAGVERDTARSPLFQVAFSMERIPGFDGQEIAVFLIGEGGHKFHFGDLQMESIDLNTRQSQFEILLVIEEAGGNIYGCWQYNRDLFEESTIHHLHEQLVRLLHQVADDPTRRISEYSVLDVDGSDKVWTSKPFMEEPVAEWNQTDRPLLNRLLVHERFEQQALKTPDRVAVSCDDRKLTYRELNEQSNALAHYLQDLGVRPSVRIGICLERHPDLLVAILGILKAGGTYVPLDVTYPEQRLRTIVRSAELSLVLTHEQHQSLVGDVVRTVCLDADRKAIAACPVFAVQKTAGPDDLIYIIFTSGSTGQPKGVGIRHSGFANLIDWFVRYFEFQPDDSTLVVSSPGFDLTQKLLMSLLTVGGETRLSSGSHYDPDHALKEIAEHCITMLHCTPSHFHLLLADDDPDRLDCLQPLKSVLLGGEPMDLKRLAVWRNRAQCATRLFNTYGPTECTDHVACYPVSPDSNEHPVPIGFPISNVQFHVVDENLRPVLVGQTGELAIAGACVGAGYVNDAVLTEQKFVRNPFSDSAEAKMYLTGDLCRYRADGAVEFLGRKDNQIKLRGFRIELGEIETRLRDIDGVADAAVIVRGQDSRTPQLVAYCVFDEGPVEAARLKSSLSARLPDYMVPVHFVPVERMPLNVHGKLDRHALPEPDMGRSPAIEKPRDETEEKLLDIWRQVLGLESIGVTDGFFALGGDSMQSVELMVRIRREFGMDLPLALLLQHDTIAEIAERLRQQQSHEWSAIVPFQPHGQRPPLFCVHPIGGNVLCYAQLASCFDKQQPVYGIQARGVDESTEPVDSMDAIVQEYMQAVAAVQQSGPIHLAAWSSGGVIAYEMARRFRQQGRNIAWVALFDSYAPNLLQVDSDDESTVLTELISFLKRFYGLNVDVDEETLRSLDSSSRIAVVQQQLQQSGFLSAEFDEAYLRRFLLLCQANLRAIRRYEVICDDVPTILFRARDPNGRSYAVSRQFADDLGWSFVVGDALQTIPVSGDHVTILTGDSADQIASELSRRIDKDIGASIS